MNIKLFKSILEGFGNYAFRSETVKELAEVRAKICAGCPHANPKFIFKHFKDSQLTDVQGLGCDKCSCLISAKVRSVMEVCPLEKW